MARGSLSKTIHWLRLAYSRNLLSNEQINRLKPLIDKLAPRLKAYLISIGHK